MSFINNGYLLNISNYQYQDPNNLNRTDPSSSSSQATGTQVETEPATSEQHTSQTSSPINRSTDSTDKYAAKQGMSFGQADYLRMRLLTNTVQTPENSAIEKATNTDITTTAPIGQITTVDAQAVKEKLVNGKPGLAIEPRLTPGENGWRPVNSRDDKDKQYHSLLLIDQTGRQTQLGEFFAKAPDGKYYILEKGAKSQDFLKLIQELPPAQRDGALAWAARRGMFDANGVAKETRVVSLSAMKSVRQMSSEEKLAETLRRTIDRLPPDVGEKLKGLLSPTSLTIMTGTMAVWAASHAVGAGEIADVVLGGLGLAVLGSDAIKAGEDLYKFGTGAVNANSEAELDAAAGHLSEAISTIGIDAALAALTHKAAGEIKGGIPNLPPGSTPQLAFADGVYPAGELAIANPGVGMRPLGGSAGTTGAGILSSSGGSTSGGSGTPTFSERVTAMRDKLPTPEAKAEFDKMLASAKDSDGLLKSLENGKKGDVGNYFQRLAERTKPVDVGTALAGETGKIFTNKSIDLSIVKELTNRGVTLDSLTKVAEQSGQKGVDLINLLTQRKDIQPHIAVQVVELTQEIGRIDLVYQLIKSGKLQELGSFRSFLETAKNDLKNTGNYGKIRQLEEATQRALNGNKVDLERSAFGEADILDHTSKEALQMKTVTSPHISKVVENIKSAVNQLQGRGGIAGKGNEIPPVGYKKIVDIRIEDNSLLGLSREEFLQGLKNNGLTAANLTGINAIDELHIITRNGNQYVFKANDF